MVFRNSQLQKKMTLTYIPTKTFLVTQQVEKITPHWYTVTIEIPGLDIWKIFLIHNNIWVDLKKVNKKHNKLVMLHI